MSSVLSVTRLFSSSPSAVRSSAATGGTSSSTSATSSSSITSATNSSDAIKNRENGALGLVKTSLRGLTNYVQNLPTRKTLLGE